MARLSTSDFDRFNACILALHDSNSEVISFRRHAILALRYVISAEHFSYIEFDSSIHIPQAAPVLEPTGVHLPDSARIFACYRHEHPVIAHHQRTNDGGACKISDFLSRQQFHRLGLYNEFYRHLDTEYQLSVTLATGASSVVAIAFSRDKRDFSERDRLMLNCLRPHIAQAEKNIQLLNRLRQAITEGDNQSEEHGADIPSIHQELDLTNRETEVLLWLSRGYTNEDIADMLTIKLRTVEKHLENIYRKLGVENRGTAVYRAFFKNRGVA